MNTLKQLKSDFNEITLMKLFEIEVINKKSQENDYIIFDIELRKNSLYAFHESLTSKQEKSKKIAFTKIILDPCFSIDSNLQSLYDNCINAILDSDFYELI